VEPDEPTTTSDRAPLTGNIQSSSQRPISQDYLTSRIPGEDRRAPQNTIDESVWETVSRDLFAVWEKMKQVLWPKYLLGGMLQRSGHGMGDVESQGFGRDLRGLVGRWPDADGILQGGLSEGLRDWDLWYVGCLSVADTRLMAIQGTADLLSAAQLVLVNTSEQRADRSSVFGRFLHCVDWRSGGDAADQAAWRQYVSLEVSTETSLTTKYSSFMQSVCIIGYTLFPLVIAALLSAVGLPMVARVPVYIVLVAWSLAAGISILGGSGVVKDRVFLSVYPLLVFYVSLGCICFIS
jgi:protein YIPF6